MKESKEKHKEKIHPLLWVANIVLLLVVAVCLFAIVNHERSKPVGPVAAKKINTSAFDNLSIQAQSVYILDVNSGQVIYAKDENTPRPLASLTKVMTAVTAMPLLSQSSVVTITANDLAEDGDNGLYLGEQWTFKNLLNFSLVVSSNDGMEAIASAAGAVNLPQVDGQPDYATGLKDFITDMNTTAQTLGLTTMYFNNPTGLDQDDGSNGGVGSAKDMTKLMQYALTKYPDLMEETKNTSITVSSLQYQHTAVNTDEAIGNIPNIIASKTGYTTNADGNLSVAFDAGVGRPIIITLLDSTYDARFTDMAELASSTLAYLREN